MLKFKIKENKNEIRCARSNIYDSDLWFIDTKQLVSKKNRLTYSVEVYIINEDPYSTEACNIFAEMIWIV